MKDTVTTLVTSLMTLHSKRIFNGQVLNPDEGLVYVMTGEAEGVTVKVVGRGRISSESEDTLENLKRYLHSCTISFVEHDMLRMQFSDKTIWSGVANDYLRVTRTFHRYTIRVPHQP